MYNFNVMAGLNQSIKKKSLDQRLLFTFFKAKAADYFHKEAVLSLQHSIVWLSSCDNTVSLALICYYGVASHLTSMSICRICMQNQHFLCMQSRQSEFLHAKFYENSVLSSLNSQQMTLNSLPTICCHLQTKLAESRQVHSIGSQVFQKARNLRISLKYAKSRVYFCSIATDPLICYAQRILLSDQMIQFKEFCPASRKLDRLWAFHLGLVFCKLQLAWLVLPGSVCLPLSLAMRDSSLASAMYRPT